MVRAEYIRALIYAEQVVINRAFFLNAPMIYRDFLLSSDSREAFKMLLRSRVIVPFLFREADPASDIPARLTGEGFSVDRDGAEAWLAVCREVVPACVRLDWDDGLNRAATEALLERPFHNRMRGLDNADPVRLLADLRRDHAPDKGEAQRLASRLRDVRRHLDDVADSGRRPRREDVYAAFVAPDGAAPAERRLDRAKPFMAEIKQLADLVYSTNSTDALRVLTLTPQDSPSRLALQEDARGVGLAETDGAEVAQLFRDLSFANLSQALVFPRLERLGLDDVLYIRGTHAWLSYMRELAPLVDSPVLNPGGGTRLPLGEKFAQLDGLALAYRGLLAEIARRDSQARGALAKKVAIQLVVAAGAATVGAVFADGGNLVTKLAAEPLLSIAMKGVVVVAVGWLDEESGAFRAEAQFQLAQVRFLDARRDMDALYRKLREAGFRDASAPGKEEDEEGPDMSQPEASE